MNPATVDFFVYRYNHSQNTDQKCKCIGLAKKYLKTKFSNFCEAAKIRDIDIPKSDNYMAERERRIQETIKNFTKRWE